MKDFFKDIIKLAGFLFIGWLIANILLPEDKIEKGFLIINFLVICLFYIQAKSMDRIENKINQIDSNYQIIIEKLDGNKNITSCR